MNYMDKNGNKIKEGMKILMSDASVEEVFATEDQYGNLDLGIHASNEDYLKYHGTERAYNNTNSLIGILSGQAFCIAKPPVRRVIQKILRLKWYSK